MSMNRESIFIYIVIVILVFLVAYNFGMKQVENNVPILENGSVSGKVYFDNDSPVLGYENGKPAYIGFPITEVRK